MQDGDVETLLYSALDFCQRAFDYSGSLKKKVEVIKEFNEFYNSFWPNLLPKEYEPAFNYISKNRGQERPM